jgi:hypothetical protein
MAAAAAPEKWAEIWAGLEAQGWTQVVGKRQSDKVRAARRDCDNDEVLVQRRGILY